MDGIYSFLELLRPWISTGALLGLLELARRLWVQNRQLRMAENKDDREGYGVLIRALQEDIVAVRAEHRRCEDRLSKIEGELMGFHRQALVQSQHGAASLPATSSTVREAGERAVEAATRAMQEREQG
jgi:hypothetical protein